MINCVINYACNYHPETIAFLFVAVDPGRVWKGPWRWYHENMLDCCVPLSKIETQGITLEQFNCLAACNGLNVQTVRPDLLSPTLKLDDLDKFRELVKKVGFLLH